MKLFLASTVKHPSSIKKLKKFVGKDLKGMKMAYVPTAANGDFYGSWKAGDSIKIAQDLVKDFRVVQLEDSYYTNIISQLRDVDIIWVAGGMAGYLLYWIRKIELDKALPEILEKGTIYVGSSAGSMICAKTQESSEWYLGEPEPGASLVPGLGYIDFEIYPHYEDDLYDKIKKKWKKGKIYLLKDGEVVTVENGKVEVLGKKRFISK
jgi:dipeptidase E